MKIFFKSRLLIRTNFIQTRNIFWDILLHLKLYNFFFIQKPIEITIIVMKTPRLTTCSTSLTYSFTENFSLSEYLEFQFLTQKITNGSNFLPSKTNTSSCRSSFHQTICNITVFVKIHAPYKDFVITYPE